MLQIWQLLKKKKNARSWFVKMVSTWLFHPLTPSWAQGAYPTIRNFCWWDSVNQHLLMQISSAIPTGDRYYSSSRFCQESNNFSWILACQIFTQITLDAPKLWESPSSRKWSLHVLALVIYLSTNISTDTN